MSPLDDWTESLIARWWCPKVGRNCWRRVLLSFRVVGSGGEVKRLVSGSDVQGVPAVDPAQGDLAAGEQGPEQHAGGLGAGQQALRLDPALERLVPPFDGVRRPDRCPLVGWVAQEGEQVRPGLLQAGGDGRALQSPFGSLRPNVRTNAFRRASTSFTVLA
jgi:hypothetical protein